MNRTRKLREAAEKLGCNSFAVFNSTNLTYLTGFSGATALLIPQSGECTLYVSPVNYEQAKAEAQNATVELLKRGENVLEKIAQRAVGNLAVDTLPVESWHALCRAVGGEAKLQVAGNLLRALRSVKDKKEIRRIREACKLADVGMQAAAETIHVGVSEREVAAQAEYAMRKAGSDGTAFETIVASGGRSAFPHGSCSMDRVLVEGDLVVVDLGATHRCYRSDISRTFIVGKASPRQQRMFECVELAQQSAFEAIKPKAQASAVDTAARQVIAEAGFGEFFCHNLGHGVGLEVHEAPILSPDSKDVLEVGNVVTDEPGIYVLGFGGVRIEDTVLVTDKGAEKLTSAPFSLPV